MTNGVQEFSVAGLHSPHGDDDPVVFNGKLPPSITSLEVLHAFPR